MSKSLKYSETFIEAHKGLNGEVLYSSSFLYPDHKQSIVGIIFQAF